MKKELINKRIETIENDIPKNHYSLKMHQIVMDEVEENMDSFYLSDIEKIKESKSSSFIWFAHSKGTLLIPTNNFRSESELNYYWRMFKDARQNFNYIIGAKRRILTSTNSVLLIDLNSVLKSDFELTTEKIQPAS